MRQQDRDGDDPVLVQKGALHQRRRIQRRRPPVGNQVGDAELLRRRRLAQGLVPQQTFKGSRLSSDETRRDVVEDVDFLLRQRREGAFRDLREEDDRHPLRCRSQGTSHHETEVHVPRNHDESNEQDTDDGLARKAVLKLGRRLEQVTIFLDLPIGVAPAQHGSVHPRDGGLLGTHVQPPTAAVTDVCSPDSSPCACAP